MSPAEITELLHRQLPLTAAMGACVTAWDGATITLTAPLTLNHNHMDTAFGGSLSALSILAGYSALFMHLKDRGIDVHVLIQKSNVDFLRPANGDLVATASLPKEGLTEFDAMLLTKRRARVELISEVHSEGVLAVKHIGMYVAIRL